MVNCDTSFIFSLVFDINISQGSGYSDKQSSAWWLTTLPQFAGPCRRRVWSTSTPLCQIEPFANSAVQLSTIGDRAFPVAAAQFWNSLPDNVTSANSLSAFRQQLKHTVPAVIPRHFLTVTPIVVLAVALLLRPL